MSTAAAAFNTEQRRQYLGASDLATVLGLNPWQTPLELYEEKVGLREPVAETADMRRGKRLEHHAAELFTELTGRKLRRRNEAFVHPEHSFIRGHIDRVIEGERVIAEIKCPRSFTYRKYRREGLPEMYAVQMIAYLGLSNILEGEFLIFSGDEWDLLHFPVRFDQTIYNAAIAAGVDFWNKHVLPCVPPELIKADEERIQIAQTGGNVTLRDDENFREVADLLREAKQLEADVKTLTDLAKKKALESVEGIHGGYEGFGVRFYHSQREGRVTLDKKAMAADGIDLTKYEKQGKPYDEFRAYILKQLGE